jgi:hypothetical protein
MQQAPQPHTSLFLSTANGIIVNIIITVITVITIIIIIIIITTITTITTRFEVDNSLTIDDPHAVAEHAQVPPPAAPQHPLHPRTCQLLAAHLLDDSLYPELRVSVRLPYRHHALFLLLTMPHDYPASAPLRARVRSDTMPPAAVQVCSVVVCSRACVL